MCSNPSNQPGQLPHIVKCHRGPGSPQRIAVTLMAMAAAVEAKNGHPGGPRGGDAGDTVFDHQASFGRCGHLRGREQKQVGRRLAMRDL